jgi:hypothetical protein
MKKLLTFSLLFFFCLPVFATHLKGGEIQISPVQGKSFTYEFTVTLYCDNGNNGIRAWTDQKDVLICMGDGTSKSAIRVNGNGQGEDIGNGIAKGIYKVVYTYNSSAISFRLSVAIPNRNGNISNLPSSEQYPFYIETLFNPNFLNSTPVLTNNLANANAKAKQKFTYNPKAVDADGDSLVYRLTVVRSGDNANCTQGGRTIDNFKQPNEIKKEGTFKVDSRTGDLIWNAPTEVGVYSCAFVIEEWRKGVKISETVRDMEINVKDGDGTVTPIPPYEPAGNLATTGLALGNEEVYDDQSFTVFPNPTNAKLTAKIITDKPEKAVFQLFDMLGKVLEEHFQNNFSQEHIQEFDLQNAKEGMFFVKVQSGNLTLTKKVVKR